MKILRRLFGRGSGLSDRPSIRGPLVIVNINFFGADAARWLSGFLRRRRHTAAGEPPPLRRSMPSSLWSWMISFDKSHLA